MAEEDLTYRMRTRGAQTMKRDVDSVGRSVKELGDSAQHASEKTRLFGRGTSLLGRPLHYLRGEVGGLAKSFVGLGLAFGSVEGIHKSIETTDDLVKTTIQLHNQFGLTTRAASGLAGVLSARELAPQGLRMGLIALSKQMQAVATGNKQAAAAFQFVGISAFDVKEALASPDGLERIFERVTGAMTRLPGGAQKAAYGQMLLGRATKSLAPLLQEGALGLEQQLKWAREYGVTLDGKTIGSVEQMAAAQTQAQYAALGLQIQLGRFLAPAVRDVNVFFADVVKSFRDGRPEGGKFARTIYEIGQDLKPVGHLLKDVGGYLKDHPRLLADAAIAWLLWKSKLLKLVTFPATAYARGLITGRAYARGLASGTAEGDAAGVAGSRWFGGFTSKAGPLLRSWLPPVVSVAVALEFSWELNKAIANILGIPATGTGNNRFNRLTNPSGVIAGNLLHGRNLFEGLGGSHHTDKFLGAAALPGGGTADIRNGRISGITTFPVINGGVQQRRHRRLHGFSVGQAVQVSNPTGRQWVVDANTLAAAIGHSLKHVTLESHITLNQDGKATAKVVHRQGIKARAVK